MNTLSDTFEPAASKTGDALGERLSRGAGRAIDATRSGANQAIDSAADHVDQLRRQATPMVDKAAEQAMALTERSIELLRESSSLLRDKAHRARESTASYVSHEPFKALLFAAAAGAALALLLGRGSRI